VVQDFPLPLTAQNLILRSARSARLEGWATVELLDTVMDNEGGAHVYMLRCADGSYYVGSARLGLERRLAEHNNGTYGGYTSKRLPVVLVWADHFPDITDAIAVERRVKGRSRAKKEALIRGDYELIRLLAKRSS
jgi:putative endonuclease